ncbi:hypothetical protein ACLKA6_004568 [Drosophila palustris]
MNIMRIAFPVFKKQLNRKLNRKTIHKMLLLAVTSLLLRLKHTGCNVTAYADDLVLLITGKFLPTISELMENALGLTLRWAEKNGLGANPQKTELVLFTRKTKIESFRLPTLGGTQLKLSKEAKYLGVILDSKLSWKRNSEERMKKALQAFYVCKKTFGKRWGLQPRINYWFYTAVVRPILTYGALVWWEAARTDSHLRYLQKVQRLACLGITGCVRSTPQAALDVILNLDPIGVFLQHSAARSAVRLMALSLLKSGAKGHNTILLSVGHTAVAEEYDYFVQEHKWSDSFTAVIPDRAEWQQETPLRRNELSFYTDGSKTEEGTAAGVYASDPAVHLSVRLPDLCSVFQAEIYAVWQAIKLIYTLEGPARNISIYIDSQAAIKALSTNTVKSKLTRNTAAALNQCQHHSIRLVWVPGHLEVSGNEMADECARAGSALPASCAVVDICKPIQYALSELTRTERATADRHWAAILGCLVSKALWPRYNPQRTAELLHFNKNRIRLLTGVLTGHCHIGRMAQRYGGPYQDFCRSCGDEEEMESVQHLLCDCPALQRRRNRFLGKPFFVDLGSLANVRLEDLAHFLDSTGWFHGRP